MSEFAIEQVLHLRYKPEVERFQGCHPCPAFDLADWVVWLPSFVRILTEESPRAIICRANVESINFLIERKSLLNQATLVIAGEDLNLSKVLETVERLLPFCGKIYFEAKNINHPQIISFSMGLISFYLKRAGERFIEDCVKTVANIEDRKDGVLASWGAIWKKLDEIVTDRKRVVEFVAQSDWLVRDFLDPKAYWLRLAETKYAITPAGAGVQAPKLAEAWMMRTVPIVTKNPCFEDLESAGYPMLILDEWEELTQKKLDEFEARRRKVDWQQVQQQLTVEYFAKEILGLN